MPPALQVWALSDYPSLPGYFPSTSIYQNMNFLFWKKRNVASMEPLIETFPWILWYIWKARNDKIFNGKDISPLDTLQLASLEAECWRKANLLEEGEEEEQHLAPSLVSTLPVDPQRPTCQIDASWIDNSMVSGLGFLQGSHGSRTIWTSRLQEKPISPPCRDGRTHMGDVLFTRVTIHHDSYRDGLFRPGGHDC